VNEIALSDDLNVITAEINSYKQMAGQAIFEIGRRLKHVKENDLVHGEWEKWCNSIGMSRSKATRFITVYDEWKLNGLTSNQMSLETLYHIATIPEEERTKQHTLESGEQKTVDEMTVRELREVKQQLKKEQQAREQAEKSAEIANRKLEEAENREPEVIEKEVYPEDYDRIKGGYTELKKYGDTLQSQNEELRQEIARLEEEINQNDSDYQMEEVNSLQLQATKEVLWTKIEIDNFLEKVSVTSFRRGAIASASDETKKKLIEGLDDLKFFIEEMEDALKAVISN